MAKIQDSNPKTGGDAHTRIFGNTSLGMLLSKIQSTVIREGNELEELIRNTIPRNQLTTLDALNDSTRQPGQFPTIQVIYKPFRPDPESPNKKIQADFLIVNNLERLFTVIEVKDGHEFDTKKSSAELDNLRKITSWLAQEFPYKADYFICGFNQEDRETIAKGLKNRFKTSQILTGRELCQRMGIDYDKLKDTRKADQPANLDYFIHQLLLIPEIRQRVIEILNEIDG